MRCSHFTLLVCSALLPHLGHAEVIDLVCSVDGANRLNLRIDTVRRSVSMWAQDARFKRVGRDVEIDRDSVTFTIDRKSGEDLYIVNRYVGTLTIRPSEGQKLSDWTCERGTPKF